MNDAGGFQGHVLDGQSAKNGAIAGGRRAARRGGQARRVNRIGIKHSGDCGGNDAGEHGGDHHLVVLGHFEANQNGRQRGMDHRGECGTIPTRA